jgi:uncharacterized membrane protein YgcG
MDASSEARPRRCYISKTKHHDNFVRVKHVRINRPVTKLLPLVALSVVAAAPGCGVIRQLQGEDTVTLEKADVQSMSVDIRQEKKTICPGESVQMHIVVNAKFEGDKAPKAVETWQGQAGVNKNDKLDFTEFAFDSAFGKVDQNGWFHSSSDMMLTIDKEYEVKTVLRRRPDKFTFKTTYKPDYNCVKELGASGQSGRSGPYGESGRSGSSGQSGSSSAGGGKGGDGSPGGPGGNGTDGSAGPHVTAYATFVKTPFYDKLLLVKLTGEGNGFALASAEKPFAIFASGGPGGNGGGGGSGGAGGGGGSGNPAGAGGNGGQGGNGGNGANGGPGGTLDFVYDTRFPDLKSLIRADVSGGSGGGAGPAGEGGSAGRGGSGITPSATGSNSPPPPQVPNGSEGGHGARGASGSPGTSGPPGKLTVKPGSVKEKIGEVPGVTQL